MNEEAFRFETNEENPIVLIPSERGVTFTYIASNKDESSDAFNVGVNWSNLRLMTRKLNNGQAFVNGDSSLQVRKDGNIVAFTFRRMDTKQWVPVSLTAEDTAKLMQALEDFSR